MLGSLFGCWVLTGLGVVSVGVGAAGIGCEWTGGGWLPQPLVPEAPPPAHEAALDLHADNWD